MAGASYGPGQPGGGSGPRTGLRILVPGLPQWAWRQRGRAAVLFGSYLSALGVGLFAWGTLAGAAMLAFAIMAHVASAADVVRQRAFPGFGRWVPVVSASTGLGLGYAPLLGSLWMVAWPGERPDVPGEGYLVNLWAYRAAVPQTGDWVWYERPDGSGFCLGRVAAWSGQEAEWFESGLRVAGVPVGWVRSPGGANEALRHLVLTVPADYVLLAPPADALPDVGDATGLDLVEAARIRGRVWAQHAPLWQRRLMP